MTNFERAFMRKGPNIPMPSPARSDRPAPAGDELDKDFITLPPGYSFRQFGETEPAGLPIDIVIAVFAVGIFLGSLIL